MKKRILSMLIVIAMVMAMIPGSVLTAFATDGEPTDQEDVTLTVTTESGTVLNDGDTVSVGDVLLVSASGNGYCSMFVDDSFAMGSTTDGYTVPEGNTLTFYAFNNWDDYHADNTQNAVDSISLVIEGSEPIEPGEPIEPDEPVEPTETVDVILVLKPVDVEGNPIDDELGVLDVLLNGVDGPWVNSIYDDEDDLFTVNIGENTLSEWDYCPDGYEKPDFDITFTADADGNITITSGNATLEQDGDINYIVVELAESDNVIDPIDPIEPTETVDVSLVLKPVDTEGNPINPVNGDHAALDVQLNGGDWVDSIAGEGELFTVNIGENTLTNWDFCPAGYVKPDFDITFKADAEGNITITSDNATLENEDDVNYIVVVLTACEHTYENGLYTFDDVYHYPLCDKCDYYDPSSKEAHYEATEASDHCCDACLKYVRDWCEPKDPETDHNCFNGENCGARLEDLCTDADGDHVCDGCEEPMYWLCEDNDNDHLCDVERCGETISDCYDDEEDDDNLCDVCQKVLVTVSAKFTELNYTYDSEKDEILVSGILKVYGNMMGMATAKWYDDEAPITATGHVTEGFAELEFTGVALYELTYFTIIFVPDNQDVDTLETDVSLSSTPQVFVTAESEYQESINGYYTVTTWINGFETFDLYLLPGTEVTVKLNVQPGDSYTVEEFIYDSDFGVQSVEYSDDGRGTLTFIMPEVDGETVYIKAIFEHDTAGCTDADKDHVCDSDLCETLSESVDKNNDNLCDICGLGMAQLGSQKSCFVDDLLNSAADGDTVKLLADHAIAGGAGWFSAMWFNPDDAIAVTLDLNGFTLSVLQSDYLIGVGSGTLRIIDSSEKKTGRMANENGKSVINFSGGTLDLRDYPDPEGLTIYNNGSVVGVTGHDGEEPIKILFPENYAMEHEEYGNISLIPGKSTVTVVKVRAKITGATVTIGSGLAMNYYVSMSDAYKDAVMHFTMSNGKTAEVTGVYAKATGLYVFTFDKLPPQTMGDTIDAVLMLGDTVLAEMKDYSIKAYAQSLLSDSESSDELKQLVSDMLHYGAAAQKYTKYSDSEDKLVTTGVEGLLGASAVDLDSVTTDFNLTSSTGNVKFTSAGVWFDYNNKIYVKVSSIENVTLVVKIGDQIVTTTQEGTTFKTDAIYATGFDTVYTFELYENGVLVQTLRYSVKSYVLAMQNSANPNMTALANALYAYGKSAEAYKTALTA